MKYPWNPLLSVAQPWTDRLEESRDLPALFDVAKDLVEAELGRSRGGIMLGLSRLGLSPQGYLGGYFVLGSNAIVLNRDVLDHVQAAYPEHYNAYAFNVLLHEYLHTVGYLDEGALRQVVHDLVEDAFGPDHPATRIAAAMTPAGRDGDAPAFFRQLTMPRYGYKPPGAPRIEYVKGFDPRAASYIY